MKTNLAFLFELINSIERKQHSQKTFKPEVKRDMEKARMFAINDFKTYLKEINKVEPGFDFTTYYQNSEYGKITIGIKKKDIVGMKRLFQTIILS
jgi:ADP-glucose pyrophosphorylase